MRNLAVAVGFVALLSLAPARAQEPVPPQSATPQQHGMMMNRDQMMAEMKKTDARLQSLVQQMQSAQGDAKIQAMQTLLTELVQSQVTMHQHMSMMGEMQMKK